MALPETFVIQLFSWIITIVTLILGDDTSFSRSWPNVKIKLIGNLFSTLAFITSINNHIYEIFTASNTIIRLNQTIDLSVPSTSQAAVFDFTIFMISILLTVISAADTILTVMEDSPTMEELKD
jgi:hypothetical protein